MTMLLPLVLGTLFACANTRSSARIHPEQVTGIPNCSECHTDSWSNLNHRTPDFFLKHGVFSSNARAACAACHTDSFCSDCHAHKEEIKPSDKYKDAPERWLPHRGDYLNQHKIDGRINPASCLKCHGRQNNESCLVCHR
jgi:hypothetical protein